MLAGAEQLLAECPPIMVSIIYGCAVTAFDRECDSEALDVSPGRCREHYVVSHCEQPGVFVREPPGLPRELPPRYRELAHGFSCEHSVLQPNRVNIYQYVQRF